MMYKLPRSSSKSRENTHNVTTPQTDFLVRIRYIFLKFFDRVPIELKKDSIQTPSNLSSVISLLNHSHTICIVSSGSSSSSRCFCNRFYGDMQPCTIYVVYFNVSCYLSRVSDSISVSSSLLRVSRIPFFIFFFMKYLSLLSVQSHFGQ